MSTIASLSHRTLVEADPDVAHAIRHEVERQNSGLELIASENFVSTAILEAAGSVFTNKYAEGYPGKRYYGGCENVDVVESLAIDRAKALFGAEHANVQPHSGAQANMAVYLAVLKPGDTILGMNLAHGGHLTHGHPLNFSGKYFNVVPYGVRKDDERLDYDELASQARAHKPKLIIVGASAYPRVIDFARIRAVADEVGALMMTDMAHIAGLVAAGVHPEPGAALAFRHDDDAQDAAGTARRHGAVPTGARQGPRPRAVSRRAGRAARPHHRRQGRVLQGSARRPSSRPINGRSSPTRLAWRARSPPAASASSAAARTTT